MWIVPESAIGGLVDDQSAFDAVEATFAAMARDDAYNFPVVREALGEGRQYGFKSGLDRAGAQLGGESGRAISPAMPPRASSTINRPFSCSTPTQAFCKPPWGATF